MLADALRSVRRELLLCLFVQAAVAVFVVQSSHRLPERVATHFDGKGRADGWMTREDHARFMVGFTTGALLLLGGVFYGIRHVPESLWNIPNRGHHLAPENRTATHTHVFGSGLKLTAVILAYFGILHLLILRANAKDVPKFDGLGLALATCVLLGYVAVWLRSLYGFFGHIPRKTRL